jgi:hypothetical protein
MDLVLKEINSHVLLVCEHPANKFRINGDMFIKFSVKNHATRTATKRIPFKFVRSTTVSRCGMSLHRIFKGFVVINL